MARDYLLINGTDIIKIDKALQNMALKSAVDFDKGIANDSFGKENENKSLSWKWMIIISYGIANVRKHLLFTFIKYNQL